jgi:DNA-binding transcriptional regulator GbsR (MarR family)
LRFAGRPQVGAPAPAEAFLDGGALRELVDRIGLFMETVAAPRTMGRIYGWLLVCDSPQQSLTELACALGVSKAPISTVIRPMQEGGLVERLPSGSRQHYYRIAAGE